MMSGHVEELSCVRGDAGTLNEKENARNDMVDHARSDVESQS